MDRAPIDGIELEYEVRGSGEPVVLIHAGVCADFFAPLVEQPRARRAATPCSATTAPATRAAAAWRVRSASRSRPRTAGR